MKFCHTSHGTPYRWTRRSLVTLAVVLLSVAALPLPAGAAGVTVGQLSFTTPSDVAPSPAEATLGSGWQWLGQSAGPHPYPPTVVLARSDLEVNDAEEILGLVLAGSAVGLLPDLRLGDSRTSSMPGGGDQTRVDLQYSVSRGVTYHGTLLIAVRANPPAALLVVLGDGQLTAATIDNVLGSARWS